MPEDAEKTTQRRCEESVGRKENRNSFAEAAEVEKGGLAGGQWSTRAAEELALLPGEPGRVQRRQQVSHDGVRQTEERKWQM